MFCLNTCTNNCFWSKLHSSRLTFCLSDYIDGWVFMYNLYTVVMHNIILPQLYSPVSYCVTPPFVDLTQSHQGMTSTRPLKEYCGTWHQDVGISCCMYYEFRGFIKLLLNIVLLSIFKLTYWSSTSQRWWLDLDWLERPSQYHWKLLCSNIFFLFFFFWDMYTLSFHGSFVIATVCWMVKPWW